MKVLNATYSRSDDCFNYIEMQIEYKGNIYTGSVGFEIDGRDAEVNGELKTLEDKLADEASLHDDLDLWFWNQIWTTENTKLIEDALKNAP